MCDVEFGQESDGGAQRSAEKALKLLVESEGGVAVRLENGGVPGSRHCSGVSSLPPRQVATQGDIHVVRAEFPELYAHLRAESESPECERTEGGDVVPGSALSSPTASSCAGSSQCPLLTPHQRAEGGMTVTGVLPGHVVGPAPWLVPPACAASAALGAYSADDATFQRTRRPRKVIAPGAGAGLALSTCIALAVDTGRVRSGCRRVRPRLLGPGQRPDQRVQASGADRRYCFAPASASSEDCSPSWSWSMRRRSCSRLE